MPRKRSFVLTIPRIIAYLQEVGFHKAREVALPHKQSAVMKITRDAWTAPFI